MDAWSLHYCVMIYIQNPNSYGFLVNTYDSGIAIITIKVKQCTISWYVDDNKVSHIDEEVNIQSIGTIANFF